MKAYVEKFLALYRSMDFGALGLMLFCVGLCVAFPAQAQLTQVNTLMESVRDVLTGVSVVAITIAVIIAGYKMAFQGAGIGDVAPVIIGGVVIGAAAQIAQLLVG